MKISPSLQSKRSIAFFAFCLFLCTTCQQVPTGNVAPTAEEISKTRGHDFSNAVTSASASGWAPVEVDRLVNLYTEDAILFPPKGEPIRGHDAIRAFWTRTPDRQLLEHTIETERADISGDLLVEHGRFSIVSRSGQNPPERGTARFISSWKRGPDGTWRKSLDSWW